MLQSQEVTYAEFTMPRNKGYAPMRARAGCDSPNRLSTCKESGVLYSAVPQTETKTITDATLPCDQDVTTGSLNLASLKRKNQKLSGYKARPPAPPPRYTSPPTASR